ncbi:MAG TPA: FHA domain-containing protein [Polyangiaceae bacterium]|nr:FHA domain-containing protein [Polyangiaceae bacterium]
MALTLRLRSGDVEPEPELPFDAPRVLVGRAPGCDLQLPDPSVSPRHASIRQRGGDYVVVDEGSDNGTFAGAVRLPRHAPHPLQDGDLLRFGRVWVQVRLGPAEHPIEVQASRELARRLVDAALALDEKPCGMIVSVAGGDAELCLAEPRRPYLVGSKKGSDLRLAGSGLPARCLELRRQADQLWVTLLEGASASLAERPLAAGSRSAWTKGAVLDIGGVRLTLSDPTAQVLEQLECGPTERLADGAVIDPPRGGEDEGDEDEDAEQDEEGYADADGEAESADAPASVEEPGAGDPGQRIRPRPAPARRGGWTRTDAIVFFLAVGVLALSLWAIRWLSHLGAA